MEACHIEVNQSATNSTSSGLLDISFLSYEIGPDIKVSLLPRRRTKSGFTKCLAVAPATTVVTFMHHMCASNSKMHNCPHALKLYHVKPYCRCVCHSGVWFMPKSVLKPRILPGSCKISPDRSKQGGQVEGHQPLFEVQHPNSFTKRCKHVARMGIQRSYAFSICCVPS